MKNTKNNPTTARHDDEELDLDALENVSGGFLYSGSKLEMCATMKSTAGAGGGFVGCVYWAAFL